MRERDSKSLSKPFAARTLCPWVSALISVALQSLFVEWETRSRAFVVCDSVSVLSVSADRSLQTLI